MGMNSHMSLWTLLTCHSRGDRRGRYNSTPGDGLVIPPECAIHIRPFAHLLVLHAERFRRSQHSNGLPVHLRLSDRDQLDDWGYYHGRGNTDFAHHDHNQFYGFDLPADFRLCP
jgi:hypothetical protein